MEAREIAALSANILTACYNGNDQPLLDHCRDDIIWVGPDGGVVRTREALSAEFVRRHEELCFDVLDISGTPCVSGGPASFEVLLGLTIDTSRPNGDPTRVEKCVHLSWVDCCGASPRIALLHMTNATTYDHKGKIRPLQPNAGFLEACDDANDSQAKERQARRHRTATAGHAPAAGAQHPACMGPTLPPRPSCERICLRGLGHTTLYLDWNDVVYAESMGRHTLVHTSAGHTFESVETLSSVARRYAGLFVRCHASYLVNPAYVRGIMRCRLTLSCGTELPVPEKKYTAVKAQLTERIGAKGTHRGTLRVA